MITLLAAVPIAHYTITCNSIAIAHENITCSSTAIAHYTITCNSIAIAHDTITCNSTARVHDNISCMPIIFFTDSLCLNQLFRGYLSSLHFLVYLHFLQCHHYFYEREISHPHAQGIVNSNGNCDLTTCGIGFGLRALTHVRMATFIEYSTLYLVNRSNPIPGLIRIHVFRIHHDNTGD